MTALSCVNTHFDPKSPLAAYRAEMVGDVAELMADGMDADTAWLQVATAKITELKTERARIEKVVADAYDQAQGVEKKPAAEVPAPVATHKDPGEPAEPVTPAVVAEAIKTGVQATDRKPSEMKAELLAKIDAAMPNAKGADDQDVQRYEERGRAKPDRAALMRKYGRSGRELDTAIASVQQKIDSERAKAAENIGTVTFKVPGDGEFTVVNTKERLAEFRRKVESSPGFKDRQPRQALEDAGDGAQRGSGGRLAAFENMVDEGDAQAAVDYAAMKGLDLAEVLKGDKTRLGKIAGLEPTGEAVAEFEPEAPPAEPEAAPSAAPVQQAEPAPVSSVAGQKNLAYRGSRIASLKAMNDRLRKIAPDDAWADKNIENATDLDALQDQISSALVKAERGPAEVNPLRAELDAMSGAELRTIMERMNLAGARMVQEERIAALLAEDPAEVRAAMQQAEPEKAAEPESAAKVDDFGEKLPPARRNMAAKLDEALSDSDIANRPLSEIWPLAENEAIEDTFAAAVAHAARAEVPAKPRVAYKLKHWVEKVKTVRGLAAHVVSGRLTRERLRDEGGYKLRDWVSKVFLLEQLPRDQWKRIGTVEERPDSFTYKDGKQIASPMLRLTVDGKSHWLNGDGTVNGNLSEIRALLGDAAPEKRMEFEIRGPNGGPYKINKKGDGKYRPLMTFKTTAEAREAIEDDYASLVAAWESVKASDNITERDLRSAENRPRAGKDWRNGKDVTPEQFQESFGFKGGEFGKWVQQGKGDKERQALLNGAYDALMDLAQIAGIPPRAISLNGTLGIAFGSRGNGWASAHFEPSNLVINLTKTRGAGALAHEWFHAADNYFSRMRRDGEESKFTGSQAEYRASNFITHKPEALMVPKSGSRYLSPMTRTRLEAEHERRKDKTDAYNPANWQPDPAHPLGVRPEVEQRFADLVQAINDSPMTKRAILLDGNKTGNGYWSQMLERAARSFESYVIARMHEDGYHNDFLVNVRKSVETGKNPERYPYLLPGEIKPVADAFGALFNTIQTRTDDAGNVAMFSQGRGMGISMRDAKAIKTNISAILPNAPEIILHESVEQAPEALQDEIRAQDAWNDVEAVYWNGEIHVFPAHMASVERAEFVIGRHEIRHHGMRTRYGNKLDAVLLDMHRKNASLREAAQGIKDTGRAGPKETVKAIEEALADMPVDMVERLTGFDRFVAAVRDWLRMMARRMRANGLPNVAAAIDPKDWTDRDVAAFVLKSERVSGAGSSGVVFSRAPATDTDAFRKWFKDSQVVDAKGKPLVVYHGTQYDFNAFDPAMQGDTVYPKDVGFFFTNDIAEANAYAELSWGRLNPKPNVMPVYLSIKNPQTIYLRNEESPYDSPAIWYDNEGQDAAAKAMKEGNDGLIIVDERDDFLLPNGSRPTLFVAFNPEQIKSAIGNSGAFSEKTSDIRFSRGQISRGTEAEAIAAGFTIKAYRGISKAAPFNDTGSTWMTTDRGVAESYAEEVMGYDDPGVIEVMINPDGLPRIDASRLTDEQREELLADGFGNPQAIGIYDRSDDHPLGGSRRNVTVIHAPKDAVWVIEGATANPDIRFSRPGPASNPSFKRWFGDSKVVDDQGKPLVVYHGTKEDFSAFDNRALGMSSQHKSAKLGTFFSADPAVSAGFAGEKWEGWPLKRGFVSGAQIMPVYLSIKNPLVMEAKEFLDRFVRGWEFADTFRDKAIADGYDGIRITGDPAMAERMGGEEYGADAWVAFRPEQIKSATGNNGQYDPENSDIRFSRSAAVGVTTAQDLVNSKGGVFDFNRLGETKQDRIRTVTDGARPFWLGALTRDQIADIYGSEIQSVKEYDALTRAMENERAKMAGDADELYNEWAKLDPDVNDRLARIMLDATVHQVHPDGAFNQTRENNEERKRVHGNISTQFKLLPKEAQAMYGKVRDFHLGTLTKLRDSLMDRVKRQVENGNARAAALTSIRMQFDKYLENGPYFPLSRFGDFLVVATRAEDGERVVASYETAGEQQGAARKLEADGFTVKRKTAKSYSRQTDGAAGKFIASVLGTVDALDMDDAMLSGTTANLKSQLLDDINQMFIQALPDLSYRKHFMHRKGTAGFSSDVMRGFASSAFHSASHIARLNHGDKMTFALQDAFKAIEASDSGDFNLHSQVLNELTKRHDAAMNPNTHPIAAMLNQVGFVMYLGLSPAAGLVNMLQTVMVTMPHLGARYGFGKANGSLAAAYKDILAAPVNAKNGWNAAQSSKLSAEERKVMSDLQDEGVIDLTQAHDLASATSLDTGNVARSKAAFAMSKAMKIVGWTFHIPEVMNRQVTALSAYRLEMEKSGDQDAAKEAAREAIKRTHFDYSASNRARFMQGNVARVLLQFKQYSQNMTYLLGRAAHQALKGESPEVRAIARRQLVATLGVTFGMAGTLGLPGLGGAMSLIGMMVGALDDDDKPWDWKVEFRNLAADTFGKEAGEVLAHGIPRALMPWDISNRVGMGDMWWRNNGQEGQNPREQFASDMQNILGPTAGTVLGLYTAADQMARGNWSKAVEGMVPKALRDPLKALREGTDGVTNYNGEPLMDVTGAEVAGRLLGFAPARASEMYEAKGAVKNAETALNEKRQNLLSRMVKARIEGDGTAVQDLQVDIQAFNERNPAFKITMDSIMKSLLAKRRNTAETQDGIRLPKGKDDLRAIGRFAEVE